MNRQKKKQLSIELGIPLDEIRRELDESCSFRAHIEKQYSPSRYNVRETRRVIHECVCSADGCRVPEARDNYLADAAYVAAMYIEWTFGYKMWKPDFLGWARDTARSLRSKYSDARLALISSILNLVDLVDTGNTDEILQHMKYLERKCAEPFKIPLKRDSKLYERYKMMCLRVAIYYLEYTDTPRAECLKIFEYIKLHCGRFQRPYRPIEFKEDSEIFEMPEPHEPIAFISSRSRIYSSE